MNHTPRKTLMQRLQARVEARRTGEQGLALLDVLLGMAIFALIVIIAIQSIGQFRQRAFETGANSDAQQLSVAIESYVTDNQALPTVGANADSAALATAGLEGVNLTKNNVVAWYVQGTGANSSDYVFCVEHRSNSTDADAAALYNSTKGAIVDSKRGGGCPAAPADFAAASGMTALP